MTPAGAAGAALGLLLVLRPAAAAQTPAVHLAGEVGTRLEYIANENFAETDAVRADDHRLRARVRLRFGGTVALTEALEAGFRLSSGDPAFPSSGWTTPAEFRRSAIQIDRAYLGFRPAGGVLLRAGAQPNPLFTPTELVWDGDVQPTGLGEVVQPFGPGLVLSAGQFSIRETRTTREANAESGYLFAHGAAYAFPAAGASVTLGLAQYYFRNPDVVARALQVGELDAEFRTNRFDPTGRTVPDPRNPARTLPADFFSDFNLLNAGVRVEAAGAPASLTADLVVNLGAEREPALGGAFRERENLAYGAMLRYGVLREAGDRVLGVGFYHIEADAVLAAFNSDDLQQTNVRTVPLELQLLLPGRVRLVWDTYLQRKLDTALPSSGGVVHPENALKARTRVSALATF